MQVTFLGTSSGVPTRARNVSAVAVRLTQRSELWLFDCGEGTQHQFLRSDLRLSQLRRIFITHMHGDHVFGLPGLLASLGLSGSCSGGVDLYGPDPLESYLDGVLRTSSTRIGYPLKVHQVRSAAEADRIVFEDADLSVRATPLHHRVPAYAYRIEEKPKPGRFDINKAREMAIPPGPVYASLKRGETVTLEDGRRIDGKTLSGPERAGPAWFYYAQDFAATRLRLERESLSRASAVLEAGAGRTNEDALQAGPSQKAACLAAGRAGPGRSGEGSKNKQLVFMMWLKSFGSENTFYNKMD